MNKSVLKGMLYGACIVIAIVIALGAIYDYNETLAKVIWPESKKFKEIPIHEESIFDDNIVGSIPQSYFNKTHVCELWDGEPIMVSGIFVYDFDIDQWIWCQ